MESIVKILQLIILTVFITFFSACSGGGSSSSSATTDSVLKSSSTFKAYFAPSQNSVAVNAFVLLEFSQSVDESTLSSDNIYIQDADTNKITTTISLENSNIKVTPTANLTLNATYTLVVTTNIKNSEGASLGENYKWEFTASSPDTSAPTIKSTLPAISSTSADITTNIILEFDELLDTTNIQAGTLELRDSSNNLVSGNFNYSNQWLVFFPSANLNANESYTINILKTLYDSSSNAYDSNTSFTFTTSSTALNSDGFAKVSTDLSINSDSYSMLVPNDTTLFVGSKDKISKISTTRSNSVPDLTLSNTKNSTEFGTIYDIKTLKTQGSCSTYPYIVLATSKGVSIVDESDLSIKSSFAIDKSSFGVDVVCNSTNSHVYAYVASSSNGINILDITDSTNITSVTSFSTTGVAFDVISKNDKIYTASYSDGINVYDNTGTLLQHFASDSTARAINIDGSELIVSNGTTGIKKFTISAEGVLSESTSTASPTTVINSYSTANNIFAITTTKGISVLNKSDTSKIAYQIPSSERFINAGADSEFLYTLSLSGVVSVYNLTSTEEAGQAIDGYLAGATVFKDCNANKTLEISTEPYTTADESGNYKFTDTPYSCKDAKLIAKGGTDIDTGVAFKGILLAKSGSKNITPLTTLIESDPTLEATLLSELGISSIDDDFVEVKNVGAMKLALSITNVLTLISNTTGLSFDPESAATTISKIATELKANSSSITNSSGMADALSQAASDAITDIVANNSNVTVFLSDIAAFKQSIKDMVSSVNSSVSASGVVDATIITSQLAAAESAISSNTQEYRTPSALYSSFATTKNITITKQLGGLEPDNKELFYTLTQAPTNGEITLNTNGSFTYTPNTNFIGSDLFKFDVNNTKLSSSSVSATINVLNTSTVMASKQTYSANTTINDDTFINGDLTHIGGTLDLNGHTLIVNGNFLKTAGELYVHNGTLEVFGDYNSTGSATNNSFIMDDVNATVIIHGDFNMHSNSNNTEIISNGTLSIEGDFSQQGNSANFNTVGNHKLILSGLNKQKVSFEDPGSSASNFNILQISNSSSEGVEFTTNVTLTGTLEPTSTSIVNPTNLLLDVSATINGSWPYNISIGSSWSLQKDEHLLGDLLVSGALNLNSHTLTVDGSLNQSGGAVSTTFGTLIVKQKYQKTNGTLSLSRGSVEIFGDFSSTDTTSAQLLVMSDAAETMTIHGDFNMHKLNSTSQLSDGTLIIKGNFSQQGNAFNFHADTNHKTLLSGTATQSISFEDPSSDTSCFNILDINNSSAQGVNFLTPVYVTNHYYKEANTAISGISMTLLGSSSIYNYWDLSVDLSNINFTNHSISSIYLKSSLYGEKLLSSSVAQDLNTFTKAITDVNNYSLKVKLDNNSTWWLNFSDSDFYISDDGSANFDVNTTSDLIITPDDVWNSGGQDVQF